jgi:hypothetical protein
MEFSSLLAFLADPYEIRGDRVIELHAVHYGRLEQESRLIGGTCLVAALDHVIGFGDIRYYARILSVVGNDIGDRPSVAAVCARGNTCEIIVDDITAAYFAL